MRRMNKVGRRPARRASMAQARLGPVTGGALPGGLLRGSSELAWREGGLGSPPRVVLTAPQAVDQKVVPVLQRIKAHRLHAGRNKIPRAWT